MKRLRSIGTSALAALASLWHREPVRVSTAVTAAVLFAATKAGIALPKADVAEAVAVVIPVLLGGEAARRKVTPTN